MNCGEKTEMNEETGLFAFFVQLLDFSSKTRYDLDEKEEAGRK